MNKSILYAVAAAPVLAFVLYQQAPVAAEQQVEQAKSVAWYVANIREARKQNEVCFKDQALQTTEPCQNALHALQISFKGGN